MAVLLDLFTYFINQWSNPLILWPLGLFTVTFLWYTFRRLSHAGT